MASDSADVVGKRWKNQNKEGKMIEPDYTALWYKDEIFTLKDSTRDSDIDYKIQQCEVEIVLDSDTDLETLTYDLQFGMRFYEDNDALEFTSTDEPEFDWYRSDMEFSDELKEEPVYEEAGRTEVVNFAQVFDTSVIFCNKIMALENDDNHQCKQDIEAAAAEAAEAAAEAAAIAEAELAEKTLEAQSIAIADCDAIKTECYMAPGADTDTCDEEYDICREIVDENDYSNAVEAMEARALADYVCGANMDMCEGSSGEC